MIDNFLRRFFEIINGIFILLFLMQIIWIYIFIWMRIRLVEFKRLPRNYFWIQCLSIFYFDVVSYKIFLVRLSLKFQSLCLSKLLINIILIFWLYEWKSKILIDFWLLESFLYFLFKLQKFLFYSLIDIPWSS